MKFKQKFYEFLKIKKEKETFMGVTMHFSDYGWFCHMWREIFVSEEYSFVSKNKTPHIIDVGSNIGMSICYFKMLYPDARILAFEPEPESFEILKKNIEENKWKNVDLRNSAISASGGTVKFYQDTIGRASAIGSTLQNFLPENRIRVMNVPSLKLSSFINDKVDLLKICAEGVEHEVFMEIESKLRFVDRIFSLVHQRDGEKNENTSKILDILERNSFRYAITGTPISHLDFMDRYSRAYAFALDAVRVG